MAARIRQLTADRARSAADPVARDRPDSPKASDELLDQRVELVLGPLGPPGIAHLARLVDVGLQVADPLLVRPPGLLVQRRPGTRADIAAPDELEAVHLLLRAGQQHRQVAEALAVPHPAVFPPQDTAQVAPSHSRAAPVSGAGATGAAAGGHAPPSGGGSPISPTRACAARACAAYSSASAARPRNRASSARYQATDPVNAAPMPSTQNRCA